MLLRKRKETQLDPEVSLTVLWIVTGYSISNYCLNSQAFDTEKSVFKICIHGAVVKKMAQLYGKK